MSPASDIYRSAAGERIVSERYRDLLARWPVVNEHLRLPTGEGDTFVVASGPPDAPPVLLLQGSGANAAMWMGDIPAWAPEFRCYAVDLIGEPGRSAPARPPLASDAYAGWLDDVRQALGLDRVSIVGVSLGGWVALDYATRNPDRVTCLALLCPSGLGRQKVGIAFRALALRPFGDWGRRRLLASATGLSADPTTADAQAMTDLVQLIAEHFRPRTERVPTFTDDDLQRLTMPVLAVVGGRDAMLDSAGTKRRLESVVPTAAVRLLPEVGHVIPDQAPAILDFLRDSST